MARCRCSTGRATSSRTSGSRTADGPYGADHPLKFTFLETDQQALAKVAAGFETDLVHPQSGYVQDWLDAGLIQPWTVEALPEWANVLPQLAEVSVIDGRQYQIPWDWGTSSVIYRAGPGGADRGVVVAADRRALQGPRHVLRRRRGGGQGRRPDRRRRGPERHGRRDDRVDQADAAEAARQRPHALGGADRPHRPDDRGQRRHRLRLAVPLVRDPQEARGRGLPAAAGGPAGLGLRLRAQRRQRARRARARDDEGRALACDHGDARQHVRLRRVQRLPGGARPGGGSRTSSTRSATATRRRSTRRQTWVGRHLPNRRAYVAAWEEAKAG